MAKTWVTYSLPLHYCYYNYCYYHHRIAVYSTSLLLAEIICSRVLLSFFIGRNMGWIDPDFYEKTEQYPQWDGRSEQRKKFEFEPTLVVLSAASNQFSYLVYRSTADYAARVSFDSHRCFIRNSHESKLPSSILPLSITNQLNGMYCIPRFLRAIMFYLLLQALIFW